MTHSQQQARPQRQETRFSTLTARILCCKPVTIEEVQAVGTLALELAIIKRPKPVKGKVIAFPAPPPQPEVNEALAQVVQALAELKGQETP